MVEIFFRQFVLLKIIWNVCKKICKGYIVYAYACPVKNIKLTDVSFILLYSLYYPMHDVSYKLGTYRFKYYSVIYSISTIIRVLQ